MECWEAMDCEGGWSGGYFFGGTFHTPTNDMEGDIKKVSGELDELSKWLGKSRRDMDDFDVTAFREGFKQLGAREIASAYETARGLYEEEAKGNMSKVVGKVEKPLPAIAIEKPKEKARPNKVKPVKTRKFKLGEHYYLAVTKNRRLWREFVVVKTVYSIKETETHVVIMKQISGPRDDRYIPSKHTLNKSDCLNLHIKYQEGLEVFDMNLNWKPVKEKKNNNNNK